MTIKPVFCMLFCMVFCISNGFAARFGHTLCKKDPAFDCKTIKRGDSWRKLFPNKTQRTIVQHVNRLSTGLYRGMVIAIPKQMVGKTILDVAPFPQRMPPSGQNFFIFDPKKLAWGAYDGNGVLLRWGPAAGGKSWCSDIGEACHTKSGQFKVYSKRGQYCKSNSFPRRADGNHGGAPMPYCNFFHGGFAIHAGKLPGYHASHGCVRTLKKDARWLDQKFLKIGTPVHVRPYT